MSAKKVGQLLATAPASSRQAGSPAAQDIQAMAARLQRVRLSMADWLAARSVLQALPK